MAAPRTKQARTTKGSDKSRPNKNSKNGIFSKLNLRSPKTQLLLVIVSFAVIGGGIMVVSSFAATRTNITVSAYSKEVRKPYGSKIVQDHTKGD